MAEYPYMPLWTDAYLADTLDLSTAEHGLYLVMMMVAWRRQDCALPDDMAWLKRALQSACRDFHGHAFNALVPQLLKRFWTLEDHGQNGLKWVQKRLQKERKYLRNRSETQRKAALKRWENNHLDDADALPAGNAPTPTPKPTPIEYPSPAAPGAPFAVAVNGSGPVPAKVSNHGTRLDPEWEPGDEGIAYANEHGFDGEAINRMFDDFRDHFLAAAGAKARKASWPRTWKRWVRTEHERVREKDRRDGFWRERFTKRQ